jgi:hypothetical protein
MYAGLLDWTAYQGGVLWRMNYIKQIYDPWTSTFHGNVSFPDIFFLINSVDIEMNFVRFFGNNNELEIKFKFRRYWSILDRFMTFGLRIFMEISVFRIFLKY